MVFNLLFSTTKNIFDNISVVAMILFMMVEFYIGIKFYLIARQERIELEQIKKEEEAEQKKEVKI